MRDKAAARAPAVNVADLWLAMTRAADDFVASSQGEEDMDVLMCAYIMGLERVASWKIEADGHELNQYDILYRMLISVVHYFLAADGNPIVIRPVLESLLQKGGCKEAPTVN